MHEKRRGVRRAQQTVLTIVGGMQDATIAVAPPRRNERHTVLRPISLAEEEAEAIVAALATASRADSRLVEPARKVVAKLVAASGPSTRARLAKASANAAEPQPADHDQVLDIVECAIRDERELRILYEDQTGEDTIRTIRPLAFAESRRGESVAAWCHLRGDFRHFRVDRIIGIVALESFFAGERDRLLKRYMKVGSQR
jgi:predicted DNA-binding transcriptional regulator YafY